MGSPMPPRLAEAMIAAVLSGKAREFALGDLAEEFAFICTQRGGSRALIWYWLHAFRTVIWYSTKAVAVNFGRRATPAETSAPLTLARPTWRGGLESLWGDLVLGTRRSARRPGALLSAIVMLSLAVGGSTTVVATLDSFARWDPGLTGTEELRALAVHREGQTIPRHSVADVRRITATMGEAPSGWS